MGRITKAETIIRRQEDLAARLLDRALEATGADEIGVDVQLDVFEKVGKWVAIKNRIEDQGESQINDFKRRIQGETKAAESRTHRPTRAERLEALKSKLPDRSNSGNERNSGGSSGEVSATVGS